MSSKVALISVLFEQVTKRWITTQLGFKRSGWQWKVCLWYTWNCCGRYLSWPWQTTEAGKKLFGSSHSNRLVDCVQLSRKILREFANQFDLCLWLL